MGDNFENIRNSHIVNRLTITNSFNETTEEARNLIANNKLEQASPRKTGRHNLV